jgi:hypothetical protein
MAGVENLLKMQPDELRGVIAKRVEILDAKSKEHEARHSPCRSAGLESQALAGQTHPPQGQYWELCRRCNVYEACQRFDVLRPPWILIKIGCS